MAHISVTLRRWTGSREAADDEPSEGLVVENVFIEGKRLEEMFWAEHTEPMGAGERSALSPVVTFDADGFLSVRIEKAPAALREMFADPATHLLGTTDQVLELAVSEFVVVTQPAVRREAA